MIKAIERLKCTNSDCAIASGETVAYSFDGSAIKTLERIRKAYGLKNDEAALIYALGVLDAGNGQPITFKNSLNAFELIPSKDLRGDFWLSKH